MFEDKALDGIVTMKKQTQRMFRTLLGLPKTAIFLVLEAISNLFVNRNNGSLISSGEKRYYLLHVPASYDPSRATSLVISIHGFAEWPAHQAQMSRWNKLAEQFGFIVVYPSGSGFPKGWRTHLEQSRDAMPDVVFISDLIDKLEGNYNIDPERIFANGLSNGAGMSTLLSCELPSCIAAIGVVAGAYTFPWSECPPSRPVPTIVFHGTADPTVPYMGGPSEDRQASLPCIPIWVESLARRNGCEPTPIELPAQGQVSGVRYNNCVNNAEVIFYTITGGGHSWPGGEPLPAFIVGHTTQDIDATRSCGIFSNNTP